MPKQVTHFLIAVTTVAGLQSLNACSSHDPMSSTEPGLVDQTSSVGLVLPRALIALRAISSTDLFLEMELNNEQLRVFSDQQSDVWSVTVNAPTEQASSIRLRWFENYQGTTLLLASQTIDFEVNTEPLTIDLPANYTSTGPAFDADGDGTSNLNERLLSTDPLAADFQPINIDEPEVVPVAAGCFVIGSPEQEEGRSFVEPQKSICVDAFSMGKYEVTFSQYDNFAAATSRELPADQGWGRGSFPVIRVNWYEAVAYTEWLSERTGESWRLPTEAEWEYAARAGTTTAFSTGATITAEQANFDATATYAGSAAGNARSQTTPVGLFTPNSLGLHDMHGNVAEFTCSARATDYAGAETLCIEGTPGGLITVRGGSWRDAPVDIRSASRSTDVPTGTNWDLGFRVVLEN